MIEAASVHSGLIEFLKWDLTRANWVSPFTRETNSASKWLFTDSFTAGFKEKCRQFSPLCINISRNFFETIPFPFEIVEIEYRREGILKFQISHSFEYSKTFVRKGNYLTDLNFKFPRVVHLGRSRSYLYFFILISRFRFERVRWNFIHRGTLSFVKFHWIERSRGATSESCPW